MSIIIEPFTNIRNIFSVPVVHSTMAPPEVAVSPNDSGDIHCPECLWILIDVEVIGSNKASRVPIHCDSFPNCTTKNCANCIEHFSLQMFLGLVVFVEFKWVQSRLERRADDNPLPASSTYQSNNKVSNSHLCQPSVLHDIIITFKGTLDGDI